MPERTWRLLTIQLSALAILAFGSWVISLRGLDLSQMNDLGLVSILPPAAFVSLIVFAFSFCLTLTLIPNHTPLILLHLLCMIFMLHGLAPFVEELPRFGPAWRHVGIIEYITRNANVDPKIDAYFNWPGFFITSAWVQQAAGLDSALPFLKWAPIFFNLLYLGPLWLIFRTVTQDKRLIWFAIWLFFISNWVGQDYFSPQAINFFFFLVILYILLRWFANHEEDGPQWLRRGLLRRIPFIAKLPGPSQGGQSPIVVSPLQRTFLFFLVIFLFWTSVSSHQLTPFAILSAVTALTLLNLILPRSLPLLMTVLVSVWLSYMANAYLNGRIGDLLAKIGQVDSVVSANVTERMQGSWQHVFILRIRMLHTLAIWGGALFGVFRRWHKGFLDLPMLLFFAAPAALLLFQSYGGEMLIRAYLFSLPFAAFFAAALVFPSPSERISRKKTVFAGIISASLMVMFFFTRYGNERMEYFSQSELDAVQFFYKTAKPGALLASAEPSMPFKYQQYETYKYLRLEETLLEGGAADVIALLDNPRYPEAYLILTRSQIAQMHMFFDLKPSFWEQLEKDFEADGRLRLVYENEDAKIYQLVPETERQ